METIMNPFKEKPSVVSLVCFSSVQNTRHQISEKRSQKKRDETKRGFCWRLSFNKLDEAAWPFGDETAGRESVQIVLTKGRPRNLTHTHTLQVQT